MITIGQASQAQHSVLPEGMGTMMGGSMSRPSLEVVVETEMLAQLSLASINLLAVPQVT